MGDLKSLMPKKLGFGCMRLPVIGEDTAKIDDKAFCEMVDKYLEQGFCYFDTAYPYHNEKSEEAVKRCIVNRYPREQFLLADKMPVWNVKKTEDYDRIFEEQKRRCGVSYFDFYLLHAMDKARVEETERLGGFERLAERRKAGEIKHLGFSFHDSADVLEEILSNHPELEFVQLQINYYDWDSESVQSRKCYETAVRHKVPVIVMEPVKGGTLANLIGEPEKILKKLDDKATPASFAIRFAASLDNVMLVLSGMSDMEQLLDNTSYMREFQPLNAEEKDAIVRVVDELHKIPTIPCTKCRYCVEGCPKKIVIPSVFDAYNFSVQFGVNEKTRKGYGNAVQEHGKASDCIHCGKCESQCPQHLEIRKLLEDVARTFEDGAQDK